MQESEIDVIDVQEKGWVGKIKDWSYENWQTILIILIVLIIGISAYNYNQGENQKNGSEAIVANNEIENNGDNYNEEENSKEEESTNDAQSIAIIDDASESEIESADKEKAAEEDYQTESVNNSEEEINGISEKTDSAISINSEAYTVTAKYGEGIAHLARRAMEEYLQNTGQELNLSKEHKIYIEDYLQKQTGNQAIEIGHQENFSEDLIREAISNANELSPKSLENLNKYIKNIK